MKPSTLVAGDDAEAKRITGTLAANAGFPWLDAGPLKNGAKYRAAAAPHPQYRRGELAETTDSRVLA